MWDKRAHQRVPIVVWSDLVFIRWYKKTGNRDAMTCNIYEGEQMAGRTEGPRLSVEALSSVIAVEQLLPKTTGTRDTFMFYLNKYYRQINNIHGIMICKKTLQTIQEDQRFHLKTNNSWKQTTSHGTVKAERNSQSGADDR
jgi:hypothetical protein